MSETEARQQNEAKWASLKAALDELSDARKVIAAARRVAFTDPRDHRATDMHAYVGALSDRMFGLYEAVVRFDSAHPSGGPLSEPSAEQNSYGFCSGCGGQFSDLDGHRASAHPSGSAEGTNRG